MKKKSSNFVLIGDVGTTDLQPSKGCLLEVGLVELNLKNGKIKPLFDEVFREKGLSAKDRKAWLFENGYMTHEEVRVSEPFEVYEQEIQSILDKYENISFWNSSFDCGWLRSRGFSLPNELPCPMKTSAKWFDLPYKSGRGRGKFASVDEAWVHLMGENTGYKEIHRAGDDAIHEAEIMYQLYKKGVIWSDIEL